MYRRAWTNETLIVDYTFLASLCVICGVVAVMELMVGHWWLSAEFWVFAFALFISTHGIRKTGHGNDATD